MSEEKKKHQVGRPTDYRPEYCQMIVDHFSIEPFEVETDHQGKPIITANKLPTLTNFAMKIGVCRDTIHEWSRTHPAFSDAVKKAKELQEEILMQNGLFGGYDKTFAIFTAKNVCGWKDKHEVDHQSSDGSMASPKEIVFRVVDNGEADS